MLNKVADQFVECWEAEAGLMTFGQAVAEAMTAQSQEGQKFPIPSMSGSPGRSKSATEKRLRRPAAWESM